MSDMGEDDLSRRLRAANPVPSDRTQLPSGRSLEELVEQTMTSTAEISTNRPTRWRWMAAAAVVAAAAAGGGIYAATSDTSSSPHVKTVLGLKLPQRVGPPRPGQATCIVFSVDLLAQQQLAFSGTVEAVEPTSVRLTVDHWYKGGTAEEVDIATPLGLGPLREIAVNFATGHRYLVSAKDEVVTGCGYTGEYSADLAGAFAKAFGS